MKVKELIELLQKHDQEAVIYMDDGEIWNEEAVNNIEGIKLIADRFLTIQPKYGE
jgi:hypothetical protein